MCTALPAKILSVKQNLARVNLSGREIDVKMIDNNLKIGDWVLVYGDLILRKISGKKAKEINKLYNSINRCHCEEEAAKRLTTWQSQSLSYHKV